MYDRKIAPPFTPCRWRDFDGDEGDTTDNAEVVVRLGDPSEEAGAQEKRMGANLMKGERRRDLDDEWGDETLASL